MIKHLKPAVILFVLLTVLTGVIYPGVVTGLAQLLFPYQANGSLITDNGGKTRGSSLIGQPFRSPGHFWGRHFRYRPTFRIMPAPPAARTWGRLTRLW